MQIVKTAHTCQLCYGRKNPQITDKYLICECDVENEATVEANDAAKLEQRPDAVHF